MVKDDLDPGTIDAFPRRGRPPLADRPMTPAERKARSRAAGEVYEIRLTGKDAARFQQIRERLNLTPSETVSHLLQAVKLPRRR